MTAEAAEGAAARIRESGLFDVPYYAAASGLRDAPAADLIRHYLSTGERAGLPPSELFHAGWYRRQQPDAAACALLDYIDRGPDAAGPHPLFDQAFYLGQPGAHLPPGCTPLAHFMEQGWRAGLDPHPLFSVQFYLDRNPDVQALSYNPLVHFLTNGWREGRDPGPFFDMGFYLRENADVAAVGDNPLLHFVKDGARERRNPSPEFDMRWYEGGLPAGTAAGLANPLVHYVLTGRHQGFTPKQVLLPLGGEGGLPRAAFDRWAAHLRLMLGDAPADRPVLVAGEAGWAGAPANAVVVVAQPGDTVLPGGAIALARAFQADTMLATGDAVAFDGDTAFPVLLPGANPAFLAHTAVVPCFAASAGLLHATPQNAGEPALDWFRRLLAAALSRGPGTLRHVPVPVMSAGPARFQAPSAIPAIAALPWAPPPPAAAADVAVIICTKDCGHLLAQLVQRLVAPAMHRVRDVVLVLNRPENAFAKAYHDQLARLGKVRVVHYDQDYNFSDQCNAGAARTDAPFLLFLNDDVVPVGDAWLDQLLASFDDPDVAVAGPLLLYPDETVQHAGMFLGFNNVCGHRLRGARLPRAGLDEDLVPTNCSAVTGAVMLVRAAVFQGLGGFDYSLATYLQDLDFCLRVLGLGRTIVFNPRAVLFHMESVSAASMLRRQSVLDRRGREHQRFAQRWGNQVQADRYHNVNWSRQDEAMRVLSLIGRPALLQAIDG